MELGWSITVVLVALLYWTGYKLILHESEWARRLFDRSLQGSSSEKKKAGQTLIGTVVPVLAVAIAMSTLLWLMSTYAHTLNAMKITNAALTVVDVTMLWYLSVLRPKWLGVVLGLGVALSWLISPNWFTLSFGSCIIALATFSITRFGFRICLNLSIGCLIYDVVAVWYSGLMQKVARSLMDGVPSGLMIPSGDGLSFLGLGDILLPGFTIMFAVRFSQRNNCNLFWPALAGYCFGLVLAMIGASATKSGQPALFYIIPCLWVALILAARKQGVLNALRTFNPALLPRVQSELEAPATA